VGEQEPGGGEEAGGDQYVGAAAGERADHPVPVAVVDLLGAVDENEVGQGHEDDGEGGAGKHEPYRVGAGAQAAEQVDDGSGDSRAEDAEPHVGGRLGHAEERDAGGDGGRRPGVDAEQSRVGQRVAGERLHDRAGDAQADADHDAE